MNPSAADFAVLIVAFIASLASLVTSVLYYNRSLATHMREETQLFMAIKDGFVVGLQPMIEDIKATKSLVESVGAQGAQILARFRDIENNHETRITRLEQYTKVKFVP